MSNTYNVTMNAPAGYGGEITGMPSGQIYNVGSSGVVTVNSKDVSSFIALGFSVAPNTVSGIGTPGTGVTAVEYGSPYSHVSRLTIAGVLGAIAGGASLGLGFLLYTLPAGAQIVENSWMSIGLTQTQGNINANTPNVGIGHTVASGAVSTLAGTAAFMDIITQQAATNCTGTPTAITLTATSSPFSYITQAGGTKTIYLNFAAAWNAGGDAGALINGNVILNWRQMI
jgi:hypothetical protein